jgi:hypothetical protein
LKLVKKGKYGKPHFPDNNFCATVHFHPLHFDAQKAEIPVLKRPNSRQIEHFRVKNIHEELEKSFSMLKDKYILRGLSRGKSGLQ